MVVIDFEEIRLLEAEKVDLHESKCMYPKVYTLALIERISGESLSHFERF